MTVEGDLKVETQREIISVQDWTLLTKYHATKLLQTATTSKCELCLQFEDKTGRFTSACPILAKGQHIKRHDSVCVCVCVCVC